MFVTMIDTAADDAATYFWVVRWITEVIAVSLMAVATMIAGLFSICFIAQVPGWLTVRAAAWRLSRQRISLGPVPDDGANVNRPDLEAELNDVLNSDYYRMVLVFGPKGSGKSSLIRSVLRDRRGVLHIHISQNTNHDARDELFEKVSSQVHVFGSRDRCFVENVFQSCPGRPIVLISVEADCNGDDLRAVLRMGKTLGYENGKSEARFVVDLPGCSSAAMEASSHLSYYRGKEVHVGPLSTSEALHYTTDRLPQSLKGPLVRDEIARTVVDTFDGHILTLQGVCKILREGNPTFILMLIDRIEKERVWEERKALCGWNEFTKSLSKKLDTDFDATALDEAVELLLQGPQDSTTICRLLARNSTRAWLMSEDLWRFNANAGNPPLSIDPFDYKISLSGKAIESALRKKRTPTAQ